MAVNRIDEFFEKALKSILKQSFEDFELIIVANAMSQDDYKILSRYKLLDDRINVISISLPGLANALNFGIVHSRADIIARMDADDISLPDRFKTQIEVFKQDPEIVLTGSRVQLIDRFDNPIKYYKFYETDLQIRTVLPYRNPLVHPSIMVKKQALVGVGGYRYGHMSEDHELFIRLARNKNFKFYNCKDLLFLYRRHPSQITNINRAKIHFAEVSGFLLTEFLLTGNPKYLVGCAAIHPLMRKIRSVLS
jgi:glycosyltransferase involved in cell wall biosynthesis